MSDPDGEWIEINPPDEDGDVVVRLVNRPNWHVAAHGDTLSDALRMLADMLEME